MTSTSAGPQPAGPQPAGPHPPTGPRDRSRHQINDDPAPGRGAGMKGMGPTMLAPLSSEEFSPEWWDEAACRDGEGGMTTVYFSEELQDIARAKTLCTECPAMLTCLEGAIARREP